MSAILQTQSSTSIGDLLVQKIEEAVKQDVIQTGDWTGSRFEAILKVPIDRRGEIGETIIAWALTEGGYHVVHSPAVTAADKHHDMTVSRLPGEKSCRIEVKLATRGKNNKKTGKPTKTFQHEKIGLSRMYDLLVLFDVAPGKIYLKVYDRIELKKNRNKTPGLTVRDDGDEKLDWTVARHEEAGNEISSCQDICAAIEEFLPPLEII